MNNRRSRFLLSVLVTAIVIGLLLVPAPTVFGLSADLETTKPPVGQQPPAYKLGEPVELDGEVALLEGEVRSVARVTLNVLGPQAMQVNLPLLAGLNQDLTALLPLDEYGQTLGQLFVDVVLDNVIVDGFGYGYGYYTGGPGGGRFKYHIKWIPPIFLSPRPVFTQVPAYEPGFSIPQLQAPAPPDPASVLPNTAKKFDIPTLGAAQGTALPNADFSFDIPQVTVTSNVPETVPNLPDSTAAFDVPTVNVAGAPAGVPELPDTAAAFDIPTVTGTSLPAGVPELPDTTAGFDIPLWPAPQAPGGEPNLPDSMEAFTTPLGATPKGITWDGTNFWMLVTGANAGDPDRIIKVDSSGTQIGNAIIGPSTSRAPSGLEDLVYLNGSLWVLGNFQNTPWWWNIHVIYQIPSPSTSPATVPDWDALTQFSASEQWSEMGGITAGGSGGTGTLWLVRKDGGRFFQLDQSGIELGASWSDASVSKNGVAFNNDYLYTGTGSTITQWQTNGTKGSNYPTSPTRSGIQGMTFRDSVLYFVSNVDKKVYKSFIATTVTTDPRGVAVQTVGADTFVWVLVNGEPKDKLLKINVATGALAATFGSSGAVDAPSTSTEGITLFGGALWIVANEGNIRKLYKVSTATGAQQAEFDLGAVQIYGDIGDLANDGTNLALYEKSNSFVHIISYDSNANSIAHVEGKGTCCPQGLTLTGARGLAYHSGRQQYLAAGSSKLATFDNAWGFVKEQTLTVDLTSTSGVQGVTFDGDLLYVVRKGASDTVGKVTRGGLVTTVTTNPRGIALSTTAATAAGRALWILVDGDPKDKVLKVNADTGALLTSFDAPSDKTEGISFLKIGANEHLWIVANDLSGRRLYKVNPANGNLQSTFDIGSFVWDDRGDLSNDGVNLIAVGTSNNQAVTIDTSGQKVEDKYFCCPTATGARGLAYHSGRQQYFTVNGAKLAIWDKSFTNLIREQTLTADQNAVSNLQGLVFEGDVLYTVRSGKVTKGALLTSVTTDPRGIAFTPSTSAAGRALWVLVDGDPKDKLLKVDPDSGLLISAFGDGGAVDAPSDKTEGIAYLKVGVTDYLWVVANETSGKKLYKVNVTTGAQAGDALDINSFAWWDIGDITSDGANLIVYTMSENRIIVIDNTGQKVSEKFPFSQNLNGGRGLAYHGGRSQFYAGSGGKLLVMDTEFNSLKEQSLTLDGANVTGLQGLAFDSDVLYTARAVSGQTGKIGKGALRTTVTVDPRGIAYSPATATPGRALWILVDGDPKDKLLKVDPDTKTLISAFGTSGAVDAPSDKTEGITFFNNFLWIVSNEPDGRKLYKVNASSGALAASENLSRYPGGYVFEDVGDITNDGSNLIAYSSQTDRAWVINTNFEKVEEWNIPVPWDQSLAGAKGLAYRSAKDQLFAARNNKILQLGRGGSNFVFLDSYSTTVTGIQGTVFVGETLYIAHTGSGKVSTAVVPSEISNKPAGLAYDGAASELYILVQGKLKDHILVVNPTTGALLRDFAAPSASSDAIAFLGGSLYVTVNPVCPPDCGPNPQRVIKKLNPTNGAEIVAGELNINNAFWSSVTGLDTAGGSLVANAEQGNFALFLNPANGEVQQRIDFYDPNSFTPLEGWQSLAYQTSDKNIFLAKAKTVVRVDAGGRKIQDWVIANAAVDKVTGVAFVGDSLYLAEAQGNTIQAAGIPLPPISITNTPKGMATDGTNLYVVVDASPWDKVLKLSLTGQLLGSFNASSDETVGVAWYNSFLYSLSHDQTGQGGQGQGQVQPRLHKLNPATGEEVGAPSGLRAPFGPGELFGPLAGGLGSDGAFLYVPMVDGNLLKLDANNLGAPSQRIEQSNFMLPFVSDLQSAEVVSGRVVVSGSNFMGGTANALARLDKGNGVMTDQFNLGNVDITGAAYLGITFYMADAVGNQIIKTVMPENTPELTIAGDNYQGKLVAEYNSFVESPLAPFRVIKNPEVKVVITEPPANFFSSTETMNVRGLVNDPALIRSPFNKVSVEVELPSTTLLEDTVVNPGSSQKWTSGGLWYISCQGDPNGGKVKSPQCAWRYGRAGQPDFDTGARTEGSLTMQGAISVGPGSKLSFATWYDTEPPPDRDKKTVEVAVITKDLQGNDVVGPFQPVVQLVGRGFSGIAAPPPNAHPSFSFVEVDPAKFNPGPQGPVASFFDVFVDLQPFEGQRIKARFHFDSMDNFGNSGNGWYVDDVRVTGAGIKWSEATVTALNPAVVVNGETYFGQFNTPVTLADGQVTIRVKARQPYAPFLVGEALVSGFLDKQPPALTLFGIPAQTNQLQWTLKGTVNDMTFKTLEIKHRRVSSGIVIESPIFILNQLPQNGQFTVPVFLEEGENVFTGVASDEAGASTTVELRTKADTIKPTVANVRVIIPVGETKARPGDQVIMDISASDGTGSGVGQVLMFLPGDTQGVQLMPKASLPGAVRDLWQVTGDFVGFGTVPAATPPGLWSFTVKAIDQAGNVGDPVAGQITVVSTLEKFNRYLMPGYNFISTPLQCTGNTVSQGGVCSNDGTPTFDIAALLEQVVPNANPNFDPDGNPNTPVRLKDVIETISTFTGGTAATGTFQVYTTDPAADSLTKLEVLTGYLVKAKAEAFKTSDPIAAGFPPTPAPMKLTFSGSMLLPGTVPPVRAVVGGWNTVSAHTENSSRVERFLQGVSVPQKKWASLLTYINAVTYTPPSQAGAQGVLSVVVEAPKGKFEGDTVAPGDGFWLYMVESGNLVSVLE